MNILIINLLISQHICVYTIGNTLDLISIPILNIISKPTQGNINSDHHVIYFDILVSPFIFNEHAKHYRNISKINLQLFVNYVYTYISLHSTHVLKYIFSELNML